MSHAATARPGRIAAVAVLALLFTALTVVPARAVSPDVVVSQVYGGGNNSGSTHNKDYIELFNRGTTLVDLDGWSVQYAPAASGVWQVTPLTGTIAPGQYFLVEQQAGGVSGFEERIPEPDVVGGISMSATAGKVALVQGTTGLACGENPNDCFEPADPRVRDFIGYGTTSNFEGTDSVAGVGNAMAAIRGKGGCRDTDDNASDLQALRGTPRNSSVTVPRCDGGTGVDADAAPVVLSSTPKVGSRDVGRRDRDLVVNFSEPVTVDSDFASLRCSETDDRALTVRGGPVQYLLEVDADFAFGDRCVLRVLAGAVRDLDGIAPEAMAADHLVAFEVEADPLFRRQVRIREIQGRGHVSPLLDRTVADVPGIVTAIVVPRPGGDPFLSGFWIQDPEPDDDIATSEGVFVQAASDDVAVGERVTVSGTVGELQRSFRFAGLTTTAVTNSQVQVRSSGNPLPEPVVVGAAGRIPPDRVIDDDSTATVETSGSFDPATDGIDFYESLEGMLVQVDDPLVVAAHQGFGETAIVGDGGRNASGIGSRGNLAIAAGDFNPERITIDDAILPTPKDLGTGDRLAGPLLGIMDYNFENVKLQVTAPVETVADGPGDEVARAPAPGELTVASFNILNFFTLFSPQISVEAVAEQIVVNLGSPDVVALQEVLDDNGTADQGVVSADQNLTQLVADIAAAGGPPYQFRDIDPENGADGGIPGGNIRNVFLFRSDRGLQFVDRPGGNSGTDTAVSPGPAGPQLSVSPGRVDPANSAWSNSRKPLVGEFLYNGRSVIIVNNHFNAKIGDQALFGAAQPPIFGTEPKRVQQAQVVNDFVDEVLALDDDAAVVVLGDLNEFEFARPLQTLERDALFNLTKDLPRGERYTFNFQGNAQALDHVLVSPDLAGRAPSYDIVHVNVDRAEVTGRASDHDPVLAYLPLPPASVRTVGFDDTDLSVPEGDADRTVREVTVRLSSPSPTPVSVDFATADGTAVAGEDYAAADGTLTFAAGVTEQTVAVEVLGDERDEPDEEFSLLLSDAAGADVVDGRLVVTVVDDDETPVINVADVTVVEGDEGVTVAEFPLSLSAASGQPVEVRYETVDGSALAQLDYRPGVGRVVFQPGQETQTVRVDVLGDEEPEDDKSFTLQLSDVQNATLEREAATGTIIDDDQPVVLTPICAVQGDGPFSPLVGETVTTTGVVYARAPNGLYLQDVGCDADPATSDGVFVFTGRTPDAAVGDEVQAGGTVTEFFGSTQVTATGGGAVEMLGSGNALPVPTAIDAGRARSEPGYYESLEHMRVVLERGQTYVGTNRFGESFLLPGTADARVGRTDPTTALLALDDGVTGSGSLDAFAFDTVEDAVGPLAFSFGNYKLLYESAATVSVAGAGDRPAAVAEPAATQLGFATWNLENVFDDDPTNTTGPAVPVVSPADQAVKRAKLARGIVDHLHAPAVLAVQEVETVELLRDLAAEVNAYAGDGAAYQAVLQEGNDVRGIDVGFLIDTARVEFSNVRQIEADQASDGRCQQGADEDLVHDRVPLAVDIAIPGAEPITVVSNHLKSKFGGTAANDFFEACRVEQAESLLRGIDGLDRVVVLGDLNAFEDSSTLSLLTDEATGLTNLVDRIPADRRFSFVFEGRTQFLDHALVSEELLEGVGAVDSPKIVSDVPVPRFADDASSGLGASDHDPILLTLDPTATDPTQPGDPSEDPGDDPTEDPTEDPSDDPTEDPSDAPSDDPTEDPSDAPSDDPSDDPSEGPSDGPSEGPSDGPSEDRSDDPSDAPSDDPSEVPSDPGTPAPGQAVSVPIAGSGDGQAVAEAAMPSGTVRVELSGVQGSGELTLVEVADPGAGEINGIRFLDTAYRIEASGFTFDSATLTVPYTAQQLAAADVEEAALELFRAPNEAGYADELTVAVDPAARTVTGRVDGFSTFRAGAYDLDRVAGGSRIETAAQLSAATFEPGVATAYVANGFGFADALSGGPAAGGDAPILLTGTDELPAATADELRRLRPSRIVVLGGAAAVSEAVEAQLGALTAARVERLFGADRFATSAAVSRASFPAGVDVAYVATGGAFPDALAGGAAAARDGAPLVLVGRDALPGEVAEELRRLRPARIVLLGGEQAVSETVRAELTALSGAEVQRLAGADRYATAAEVVATFGVNPAAVHLATGADFPDALAAVPAAARAGGPVVLTAPDAVSEITGAALDRLDPDRIVVLGGERAIQEPLIGRLEAVLAATGLTDSASL